jgi:3-methyladenine DNA glycosylase AlkC
MSAIISEAILKRKGSPTTTGVPKDVLALLNAGRLETVNLCEWLVVDQQSLAERVFRENGWRELVPPMRQAVAALKTPTAPKRMEAIAGVLAAAFRSGAPRQAAVAALAAHPSDLVRAWAGWVVGLSADLPLAEKLRHIRPLAGDRNMSVRETAWLAVRESLAADIRAGLRLLTPFTAEADANLRRFASEATRPRGVWCRHIQLLKDEPAHGLPLLEPLRADPSGYVRDSVANWLNDASKTRPDWVREVCARWRRTSAGEPTAYIVKRALRTIG